MRPSDWAWAGTILLVLVTAAVIHAAVVELLSRTALR